MSIRPIALTLGLTLLPFFSNPSHGTQLAGSQWAPTTSSKQSIKFQSDGRVAGSAGCNRFFGSYKTDGNKLSFGALGATKMMCSGKAMEQEQNFFEIMAKVAMFERDRQRLIMLDENEQVLLELVQQDAD